MVHHREQVVKNTATLCAAATQEERGVLLGAASSVACYDANRRLEVEGVRQECPIRWCRMGTICAGVALGLLKGGPQSLHRTAKGSALDVGYAYPQLDARIQKGSAR